MIHTTDMRHRFCDRRRSAGERHGRSGVGLALSMIAGARRATVSVGRWAFAARRKLACGAALGAIVLIPLLGGAGCESAEPTTRPARYEDIGLRAVPDYLRGSLLEVTEIQNTEPFAVDSYGLVVGLSGTGGNDRLPQVVRNYMLDDMFRHGLGTLSGDPQWKDLTPERVMASKNTSVVKVTGRVPAGARHGQHMDLFAESLPDTDTTNLARGRLYQVELRIDGANPFNPRGNVNSYALGSGPVFVNPARQVGTQVEQDNGTARASLRTGWVIGGGMITVDRPIWCRIRQPQLSMARGVEQRIRLQFPVTRADNLPRAQARDEGIVDLYVPVDFEGDWEHFIGVVSHLFLDGSAAFSSAKASELVDAALQPNAPLMDISYAWEGLGKPALAPIARLYGNGDPGIAFAAARAGAFLGDPTAQQTLVDIARDDTNPFQFNSVRLFGELAPTPRITRMLSDLIDCPNALVRIEAYRNLVKVKDQARIFPQAVKDRFVVDVIPSSGPPLIYASRVGTPRLAMFGSDNKLKMPLAFTAFDRRLLIHGGEKDHRNVSVFYRDERLEEPTVRDLETPDVMPLVLLLGGYGDGPGSSGFSFSYSDVVGILQSLSDRRDMAATFVLQDLPGARKNIDDAPIIPDRADQRGRAEASAPADAPGVNP